MKDFGKIATVNGSITAIVTMIPIFGTLLILGGLGYATISIYRDNELARELMLIRVFLTFLSAGM